jgi:hypothetical protein
MLGNRLEGQQERFAGLFGFKLLRRCDELFFLS